MIPRRLAENLRAQNWTTITIEFVLLVLGVFLGIQAANWNETRREQALEAEYLVRLGQDFRAIDQRLQDSLGRWETRIQAPVRVLADLDAFRRDHAWPRPKAEILEDLERMQDYRVPAPRAAAYVELLSTGRLGLIRDPRLRAALLEYDTQVGYTQTAFDILVRRVEPHRATLIAHLEFNRELGQAGLTTTAPGDAVFWADVDLDGLAADPQLTLTLNLLASASTNQRSVARVQREKALAVLAILEPGSR